MKKFVLIDDDPLYHHLIQLSLCNNELVNYATFSMYPQIVLDYLEENKLNDDHLPDCIFIDLNMPDFTGWDFLNCFAKIYQSIEKKIQVHIVSVSNNPKEIERSRHYSFVSSYINKPISRETIAELVC